jgi:hypothetical protein
MATPPRALWEAVLDLKAPLTSHYPSTHHYLQAQINVVGPGFLVRRTGEAEALHHSYYIFIEFIL